MHIVGRASHRTEGLSSRERTHPRLAKGCTANGDVTKCHVRGVTDARSHIMARHLRYDSFCTEITGAGNIIMSTTRAVRYTRH